MRVDLQIDDDVYEAAEKRAVAEGKSVGEVLSDLARKALERDHGRIGFPVFSVSEGAPPITLEMVKEAEDDG